MRTKNFQLFRKMEVITGGFFGEYARNKNFPAKTKFILHLLSDRHIIMTDFLQGGGSI